jgi:hypothetical protein
LPEPVTPSSSVTENVRAATAARNAAAAIAWSGDRVVPGWSGSGATNGTADCSNAATSSPASAMPRITPLPVSASRHSSVVLRGCAVSRAASTRRRGSVSRTSGSGSARFQPMAGLGGARTTRSAIAITSPGGARV